MKTIQKPWSSVKKGDRVVLPVWMCGGVGADGRIAVMLDFSSGDYMHYCGPNIPPNVTVEVVVEEGE